MAKILSVYNRLQAGDYENGNGGKRRVSRLTQFIHATLQLCFVQLKTLAPSARYSTFKYPVTLKPGLGSLKGIENYKTKSGTHDFLLTFHSHYRPISHRFRDISHFRRKSPICPTPHVLNAPDEGVPLGIWYGRKGS